MTMLKGDDPGKHNVGDVNAHLATADEAERARVLGAEAGEGGQKRKGILEGPYAKTADASPVATADASGSAEDDASPSPAGATDRADASALAAGPVEQGPAPQSPAAAQASADERNAELVEKGVNGPQGFVGADARSTRDDPAYARPVIY